MNIKDLIKEAHKNAVEKGFYDEENHNINELLMLIVSELGEACEALRKENYTNCDISDYNTFDETFCGWFKKHVKDTFEDEIADVFIRLFDLCGYLQIDIESHIKVKMEYNKSREHRHGKNF